MVSSFMDADATKAKGVSTSQYGSATAGIVCGDRLCSEYPGGRAEFEQTWMTPKVQDTQQDHMDDKLTYNIDDICGTVHDTKHKDHTKHDMEDKHDAIDERMHKIHMKICSVLTNYNSMQGHDERMMSVNEKHHLKKVLEHHEEMAEYFHMMLNHKEMLKMSVNEGLSQDVLDSYKDMLMKYIDMLEFHILIASFHDSDLNAGSMHHEKMKEKHDDDKTMSEGEHMHIKQIKQHLQMMEGHQQMMLNHKEMLKMSVNEGLSQDVLDSYKDMLMKYSEIKDAYHKATTYHDERHEKMQTGDEKTKWTAEYDAEPTLKLSRANVPAQIPLHMGHYDGQDVYYIITDSSDPTHAEVITEKQGWNVELAPVLEYTPDSALSKTYFFTNGISGDGVHNYQNQVFTSIPGQDNYSALTSHIHVTWADESNARVLTSEAEILLAAEDGEIVMSDLPVVLNMPHIVWPGGQMTVVDRVLEDDSPYGGGQVLDIDTEEMTVTFIAHRGWGPDGRTIYYIVTDATPSGPAEMMGVIHSPSSANLLANAAAVDLYQFKNGIKGSGPLGFQPGIATGAPGDANYSPMWRIFLIEWQNQDDAAVLETIGDINAYKNEGLISTSIAKPMDSDHIVNCPFIDPFQ